MVHVAMDSNGSGQFDVFEIYRCYCDIRHIISCRQGEETLKSDSSREALSQLLKLVESKLHSRLSILDEISKLKSRLESTIDFSEFSEFYDFVFFICREKGQKNITVSGAISCWRLVLAGRFRLLNKWCDFVEKNQRHNISEDTWRQVLAFSRCVHENLEGYDPEGAWPVLIDDFVEHMYRTMGYSANPRLLCSCGDLEGQQFKDPLPGLKIFPGFKRKTGDDVEMDDVESSDNLAGPTTTLVLPCKRRHVASGQLKREENPPGDNVTSDKCREIRKQCNNNKKSECAVEGCLSKGFAGLFTGRLRGRSMGSDK